MTHDPLCALSKAECRASQDARHSIVTDTAWCDACQDDCQCDLIAKVRADEKSRLIRSVIVYDYSGILIRPEVGAWIALQDLEKS